MAAVHVFEIPIHDLDAAGKDYQFPVPATWIQEALEDNEATAAGADGDLRVRVSKSGTDVVVVGHLRAELTIPCARCTAPTKAPIDQQFTVMMVPRSGIKGSKGIDDEYEFRSDEADVFGYEGDTVVLDELVRDELILEIPMIPLCSEDCAGMSSPLLKAQEVPDEGGVDPRLRPLLNFQLNRFKKTDKE